MSDIYLSINGIRANKAKLYVPFAGVWFIDMKLEGDSVPSGAVDIKIGSLSLKGTIVTPYSGAFAGRGWIRVAAGAGAWGAAVKSKSYHNDAGVKRADIISDLARDVGEKLDTQDAQRLQPDFLRLAGSAASSLHLLLGSIPWRVDFDGITRYGDRASVSLAGDVQILDADPRNRVFTLAANDPASVPIGAKISDPRLDRSYQILEFEAEIEAGKTRIYAWGDPA